MVHLKVNRREHLLTILGKECGEVHKETCKILLFGFNHPKLFKLQQEFNEVLALFQMLADEGIVVYENKVIQQDKKDRVERYLLESKELGTLTEEE